MQYKGDSAFVSTARLTALREVGWGRCRILARGAETASTMIRGGLQRTNKGSPAQGGSIIFSFVQIYIECLVKHRVDGSPGEGDICELRAVFDRS